MAIRKILLVSALAVGGLATTSPANAGADPLLGEIMGVGFTFCPRGWTDASGQLLAINTNQALFSLLGTTFGGDGRTTFALPDLRSRSPMHVGQGPGLSPRSLGEKLGTESNTMTVNQMPSHSHLGGIQTTNVAANSKNPKSDAFGIADTNTYVDGVTPSLNFMTSGTVLVQNSGGSQPQNNMQPTLVIRYCIALQGVFPSRN